jgi:hypothetical protein
MKSAWRSQGAGLRPERRGTLAVRQEHGSTSRDMLRCPLLLSVPFSDDCTGTSFRPSGLRRRKPLWCPDKTWFTRRCDGRDFRTSFNTLPGSVAAPKDIQKSGGKPGFLFLKVFEFTFIEP